MPWMAGSPKSARGPARSPRRYGGRSTIATAGAASRAVACGLARATTSTIGRTGARPRSRTWRCSVAGPTARSTRRATRSIDKRTASSTSGVRTGGSYPRYRLPQRRPPIPSLSCERGTTRRDSASTRGLRLRGGWGSAWTWAGRSTSCIPWRAQRRPSNGHQPALFNNLIHAQQHRRRHCEPERLRHLEVDDQLRALVRLDREVGRFRSLEDLVHVTPGRHAPDLPDVLGVGKERTAFDPFLTMAGDRNLPRGGQAKNQRVKLHAQVQ